jgi:hypothetical protein
MNGISSHGALRLPIALRTSPPLLPLSTDIATPNASAPRAAIVTL